MTTREVAARLGVGIPRVNYFARMGRLPASGGERGHPHLFRRDDVEAFAVIPRPQGRRRPGGLRRGGAPRQNLNALVHGRRARSLREIRRLLPRSTRRYFDLAIANALHGVSGETRRGRFRAKATALMDVVRAVQEGWKRPARYADEQHRNVLDALQPWLERPERPVDRG